VSGAERFLLVALGGAMGSMFRYGAAVLMGGNARTTFLVNVTGSLLIGLIASATSADALRLRLLLATGFLGGFTTFSAWQLEGLLSARSGDWGVALLILFGSVAAGFAAVAAGFALGLRLR
jgi:fluoride exporter